MVYRGREPGDRLSFFPLGRIHNSPDLTAVSVSFSMVLSQDTRQIVVIFPAATRSASGYCRSSPSTWPSSASLTIVSEWSFPESPFFDSQRLSTQLLRFRIFLLVAKYIGKVAGGHQRGTMLRAQFFCFSGECLAEHLLSFRIVFLIIEGETEIAHA